MALVAWFAIAGQLVFVLTWLVSAALQSEYSHLSQYVTELGSGTAEAPWLVNGGLILLGLTFAALAIGLRWVLPPSRASLAVVVVFAQCALLWAAGGVFATECAPTLDDACERAFHNGDLSFRGYAHVWSGLALELALLAGPFALAWATWTGPVDGRPWWRVSPAWRSPA